MVCAAPAARTGRGEHVPRSQIWKTGPDTPSAAPGEGGNFRPGIERHDRSEQAPRSSRRRHMPPYGGDPVTELWYWYGAAYDGGRLLTLPACVDLELRGRERRPVLLYRLPPLALGNAFAMPAVPIFNTRGPCL